jgi:restriction system protein
MLSMENGAVVTTIRSAADMARSGNASDWQHRLAAQRQEAEQLAAERRQQVRDRQKARQEELLESQQRTAEEQTVDVQEQIKRLEEVLTSVLPLPPMSFDRLMATPRTPAFDPGSLGETVPGPDWSDFAPAEPTGLLRCLRRTARFRRQTAQAQGRFEAAAAEHREHESQRLQALAVARAKYHQKVTEARAQAAAPFTSPRSEAALFGRWIQAKCRCSIKRQRADGS